MSDGSDKEKNERRKSRRRRSTSCAPAQEDDLAQLAEEKKDPIKRSQTKKTSSQLQPVPELQSILKSPSFRTNQDPNLRNGLDRSLSVPDLTPRGKDMIKTLRQSLEEYVSSHASPQADLMVQQLRLTLDETVTSSSKLYDSSKRRSVQSKPSGTHAGVVKESSRSKHRRLSLHARGQESSANSVQTDGQEASRSEPPRLRTPAPSTSPNRLQSRTSSPTVRNEDGESTRKARERRVDSKIESWENDMSELFRKWGLQRRDSPTQSTSSQRMQRQASARGLSRQKTNINTPKRAVSFDRPTSRCAP